MTLPNFLIIGAPRSGTTSLYHYLKEHPQIFMSKQKELRFFAFVGETLNFKGPYDDQFVNQESITTLEQYQDQFKEATTQIARGESSPIYLWWPNVPERIDQYLPDVKLITIFRNPVERAYSDFLNMRNLGWEPLRDFQEALEKEQDRINQEWGPFYYYQKKGFYATYLKDYLQFFDSDQIHICFYEDLCRDPQSLLKNIFQFLGVDDGFQCNTSKIFNSAKDAKISTKNNLQNFIKTLFKTTHSSITDPINPNIQKKLIDIYQEDILNLQELTHRDLSHWLEIKNE